jgi:hypothetical protein
MTQSHSLGSLVSLESVESWEHSVLLNFRCSKQFARWMSHAYSGYVFFTIGSYFLQWNDSQSTTIEAPQNEFTLFLLLKVGKIRVD